MTDPANLPLLDFSMFKNKQDLAVSSIDGAGATYGDLERLTQCAARFFADAGLQRDDRIGLVSSDGLTYGLLALPVMSVATLAPLDDNLSEESYLFYFKLLRIDYLLTDHSCQPAALSAARAIGIGVAVFKYAGPPGALDFSFDWLEPARHKQPGADTKRSDIALLLTTSGTTSTPKVVPITYESILTSVDEKIHFFDFTSQDNNLIVAKMSKGTSINSMLTSLISGGQVLIMHGFKHQLLYRLVNDNRVSWLTASPAVLTAIVEDLQRSGLKLTGSRLRFIRSSGAPLNLKMKCYLEEAFSAPVIQTYGMTETRTIASDYKAPQGFKEGSVGVTLGLDIKIEQGEILVRGKGVFSGYEQADGSLAACFTDGWFHTGDMGYIDEDGYVFITGRIKEIINRGGEKISPYEVEAAMLQHPGIREAAVFGFLNPQGIEDVGAAVVLQEDMPFDLKTLRRFLQGKVSSYKMPSILYVIDHIPVNSSGKVQRKKLYADLSARFKASTMLETTLTSDVAQTQDRTSNQTVQQLMSLWQELLKQKTIGLKDHFFECGGDSLSAAALFSFVEDHFGLQVPMNIFFNEPTIEALSRYIDQAETLRESLHFLVPVKASGYLAPLYCVHTGDGEAVTYHHLGRYMDERRPVYALRFDLKYEGWEHPLTFSQLAEVYADEITRLDPIGPYHLCGTCFGGALAFEIAQVLQSRGCRVETLAMFDALYSKGGNKYLRLLRNSLDELREHSFKDIWPLILKKGQTALKVYRTRRLKKSYGAKVTQQETSSFEQREKDAILSYAYSGYTPKRYHGRVHYFASMKDHRRGHGSEDYWRALSEDFVVVPMNCRHTEINNAENSRYLADFMTQLMAVDHA